MKIIALLPIKNEELTLGACLESLKKISDEIIIIDDDSSDGTIDIARRYGCVIYSNKDISNAGWSEHSIRKRLLDLGRQHNGTHFICLDGDEIISSNFCNNGRNIISSLKPGQKITMHWVTLWKNFNDYVVGGNEYANLWKDFIFCDDGFSDYNYAFLGVSRTPGNSTIKPVILSDEDGVILHFQFSYWERNQIKQAWYRCSELISGSRTVRRINNTYRATLNGVVKTKIVKNVWIDNLYLPNKIPNNYSVWQFNAILEFFNKYGVEFFEPLQIWHIKDLNDEFVKRVGRRPKSKTFPVFLIWLNNLKNKIKNNF